MSIGRVRYVCLGILLGIVVFAAAGGIAAAAAPVVRLSIVHTLHGCHVWVSSKVLGSSTTITIRPATRLVIRPSCPMDFDLVQVRGPRTVTGVQRIVRGSSRLITFPKRGVYGFRVKNVQASTEVGLQTLGPDNTLVLTIVVR